MHQTGLVCKLLVVSILVAFVQGVGTAALFRHHWKRDIALLRACLPSRFGHFRAFRQVCSCLLSRTPYLVVEFVSCPCAVCACCLLLHDRIVEGSETARDRSRLVLLADLVPAHLPSPPPPWCNNAAGQAPPYICSSTLSRSFKW